MREVLEKIDQKVLEQLIGRINVQKIKELIDEEVPIDLVDIALAFYGQSILEDTRIRAEVIKTLPDSVLAKLSLDNYGKIFPSKEAASTQLAAMPWSTNSSFSLELIRLLGISYDFLPQKIRKFAPIETIEPVGKYYPLHDYQAEVKYLMLSYLTIREPRFIVQMPTGSGKTKTAVEALIAYNEDKGILKGGQSFLWVAHTEELCEQAIETLSKIWRQTQSNSLEIVRLYGSYDPTLEELQGSFVVSSYQKLCSKKSEVYLDMLASNCDVIVIDEAHKALARTYNEMLNTLTSKGSLLIGLTATPGRTSKELLPNSEFSLLFNKKIIRPTFDKNPILALREQGILSKLDHVVLESNSKISLPEKKDLDGEYDFSFKQLRSLWIDSERNKLIINAIVEEIKNKNPCLVFTCSVEHNVILASTLNILGIKAKFVNALQNKSLRREVVSKFREGEYDVLLNYGILTTGFDAPRIKTVIITRPTTSIVLYSQMIGRGLRGKRMGGNEQCKIIDIRDNLLDFGPIEKIYEFFKGYWE